MKTANSKRRGAGRLSDRYLDLIRQFPLRPLRSEADLKEATGILDRLFGREDVDPGEEDYVHVLAGLVEEYEAERAAIDVSKISAVDLLRHLMDERGMSQIELARLLGVGASAVSMILSGQRPLTAEHARRLGRHFALNPGVFL